MAHFARIEDGKVVQVVVVDNADMVDENGEEKESLGQAVCNTICGKATWVQTSYNHKFRKQYAGIGWLYDAVKDVFIGIQPFPSWSLNEDSDWEPPVAYPDDFKPDRYDWDEDNTQWVEVE